MLLALLDHKALPEHQVTKVRLVFRVRMELLELPVYLVKLALLAQREPLARPVRLVQLVLLVPQEPKVLRVQQELLHGVGLLINRPS